MPEKKIKFFLEKFDNDTIETDIIGTNKQLAIMLADVIFQNEDVKEIITKALIMAEYASINSHHNGAPESDEQQ